MAFRELVVIGYSGQTLREGELQDACYQDPLAGNMGYLYEDSAVLGEDVEFGTEYLCPEAFEETEPTVWASTLRERLPHALELAEQLVRETGGDEKFIERVKQSFTDFVEFCETKEGASGRAVTLMGYL